MLLIQVINKLVINPIDPVIGHGLLSTTVDEMGGCSFLNFSYSKILIK